MVLQVRGEERVEEEQRRSRELMQRVERERQLEVDIDTDTFRLRTIQYGCKLRRGRARVSEMR